MTFVVLRLLIAASILQASPVRVLAGMTPEGIIHDHTGSAGPVSGVDSLNLITNGDFSKGRPGDLPEGWEQVAKRPSLAPRFKKIDESGQGRLLIEGNGRPDAVGYLKTETNLILGKTYLFSVRFRIGPTINPQRNLLFECAGPDNLDGIFNYTKTVDGWVEGRAAIFFPGSGKGKAVVRILFRFSDTGRVVISNISLTPSSPVLPRWVRVGCTSGIPTLADVPVIAAKAAEEKTDLLLLPEYMNGDDHYETLDGPSCKLMSELARRYHMYIAGGIVRKVDSIDRLFNTVVLYDRKGVFAGMYDKIHPYSPEVNESGITPGDKTLVLQTDFGKVGFMTCYDSWFTDVAELVALKGAELILFPNAGYYRSLMPARATDNNVRILASSLYVADGIWDTGGRDVLNPNSDTSAFMQEGATFKDTRSIKLGKLNLLISSLDLNFSPSPHYNGGTLSSSPAGRRNRRDQLYYPDEDIIREKARWWKE